MIDEARAEKFLKQMRKPLRFKLFLLTRLPLAFLAGLRLEHADLHGAKVSIRFSFLNKNPFRSTYFAALSMAAEMTTGLPGFVYAQSAERKVSMLLVRMKGDFTKKAIGRSTFVSSDGLKIRESIEKTLESGEAQTVEAQSIGYNEAGEEVARFQFTWSFKAKNANQ